MALETIATTALVLSGLVMFSFTGVIMSSPCSHVILAGFRAVAKTWYQRLTHFSKRGSDAIIAAASDEDGFRGQFEQPQVRQTNLDFIVS